MVAAEHQRQLALRQCFINKLGKVSACPGNLWQISRTFGSDAHALRFLHLNIAQILNLIAKRTDSLIEPGESKRGRPHIYAPSTRTKIHGRTDHRDAAV